MEVRVLSAKKAEKDGAIKAFATVEINDALVINGVRLVTSKSGNDFIGFPSKKLDDGKYVSDVNFKKDEKNNSATAKELETKIIEGIRAAIGEEL